MLLKDKVTFVTGARRGIGRAIARLFAENGAIVYANAVSEGSLDDFACENIIPIYFDVTDTSAAKSAIMRIKKEQGRLDALVNNAGIMHTALIGMADSATTHKMFDVNVLAVLELVQLAARLMTRQKSGSIINLSSIVGVNGQSGQLAYSATKGAVIALTKSAAKELAPSNVRVNAIAPGMIDTDLLSVLSAESAELSKSQIGMGRLGTPDDIARACLFFASDLSEYVTGQILGVDGSMTL